MDKHTQWIAARVRIGWIILAVGVVIGMIGIFLELRGSNLPFAAAIVTGWGILGVGTGIGVIVRYRAALRGDQAARRLTVEELDERNVSIRARAGNRAYWASTALVFMGLMWASFAANGSMPDLSGDVLWYFLVVCVAAPFGVYVASILVDQRNL